MTRITHPTWECYLQSHSPRREPPRPKPPRPIRVRYINMVSELLHVDPAELRAAIMEAVVASGGDKGKCGRWLNRMVATGGESHTP